MITVFFKSERGCPWEDLPSEFEFQKFNHWAAKEKWLMAFKMLVHETDLASEFIDESIAKAVWEQTV